MKLSVLVILVCLTLCTADVYMHNPRGSNNRLNEANAVRNNGNRLFDSQNNNRGGYNVGDKTDNAFDANDPEHANIDDVYDTSNGNAADKQYHMAYYEGSQITVEWTNQHGCGGNEAEDPHKANCNMVIQYMCDKDDATEPNYPSQRVALRNGGTTTDLTDPNTFTETPNTNSDEGRQEADMFYYSCEQRERNKGLLTLDQKLQGDEAIYTRQNPNGNRNGLECPEERDYYPYWSPTPWADVAVLTDHPELCQTVYATGSQNNNDVCTCDGALEDNANIPINQDECEEDGYTWTCGNKGLPAPDCQQGPWSRVNHLGDGAEGTNNNYTWTIPALADLYADTTTGGTNIGEHTKCALRLRYNISTDDYDPWNVNASQNYELGVEQNPTVDAGLASRQGLELAINTNQFGRTFQDRSHLFVVSAKPAAFNGGTVYNLNVRGKRGNIVQTFPSVEYDFIPNRLEMNTNDFWHVQWTGSNTHNNGGDGGDGQAGDDGQGEGGTDRNNMVSILSPDKSFPIPLDKAENDAINLIKSSTCYELNGNPTAGTWADDAVRLATSNYGDSPQNGVAGDFTDLSAQLNNAPASLRGGLVCQTGVTGTYNYMSSRNNNFSNRGQKAWIKIG